MGFFSFDCKKCGHPLLSHWVTNRVNKWMESGVAVVANGSVIKGTYDGYGCLGGLRIDEGIGWTIGDKPFDVPDCYHHACWVKAGHPMKYTKGSKLSKDQGYFFEPGEHDMKEPK